jgi:Domain of unknown function (DUF4132)
VSSEPPGFGLFAGHHGPRPGHYCVAGASDTATVGIAHPLHLAAAVPAWSQLFADYQILQPFPNPAGTHTR